MLDAPSSPAGEAARLAAVRRYNILDTPPDGAFDRITALAARLFGVPISIVSVVDTDRIWFKSHHGLPDVTQIDRLPGLCASAILEHEPWVVTDAVSDPRTLANPLVAGEFGLRFYAGAPLTTRDGYNLGTLCVIDTEPRAVTDEELATLADLADVVVDELEVRLEARATVHREAALRRQAEELANALQASLLPPEPPNIPGMELATRYRPGVRTLMVGGDFFDVFRVAANDWAITVGDVCGKGASAAALTGLARWTLRAAAVHTSLPSEVLHVLNGALLTGADVDDRYCTAVLARVELDECGAWMTLASAGHPRPIVVRRGGWVDIRGNVGLPLGLFETDGASDDRVGLGPGDAIVFCTDGITEARGENGELFGEERLLDLLLECTGQTAQEIAQRVLDEAMAYADGSPQDDIALIVARVPDGTGVGAQRVSDTTGVPLEQLQLPGYPSGDMPPEPWRQRPEAPREARIRIEPDPSRISDVRNQLRRVLTSWRMEELAGGDVELLTSELATNAVVHAGTPVAVIVRYLGDVIRVEVGDGSRVLPVPGEAVEDDLGGRGLRLVEAVASNWGTTLTHRGKRVWFEVSAG